MKIYLKEKIGNPQLFTGRKAELTRLLEWVEQIKRETGKSRGILSRRKTGKTALLQRLFNIVFHRNDRVIPFYYEIGEHEQWCGDFCRDFFLTFVYQYTAFFSRNPAYLEINRLKTFEEADEIVRREGLDHLSVILRGVKSMYDEGTALIWDAVRDAPRGIAQRGDMRVLQIIDEFQYLNQNIYWDKERRVHAKKFGQAYMSTAEYKNAPLLVSGSWVGWLMGDLMKMPARFRITRLSPLPEDEAIEMIYRYSIIEKVPITDETAHLIAGLSEGNPFYISELMLSEYPEKDLTTEEGVLAALEYETLNDAGSIRGTWMEYVHSALSRVNQRNAKNIVLYLCKHRDREVTRKEIRENVVPDMDDIELEKKLKALLNADIIERGQTNFDFKGVQDNIFDKVFRGEYQKEIESFDPREITNEYKSLFDELLAKYRKLMGEHGQLKGRFAEYMIIRVLMRDAYKANDRFTAMMENLPEDFNFVEYQSVWSWSASPVYKRDVQVDIFARAGNEEYSLIGEVKNREKPKFSREEAEKFVEKAGVLKELEEVSKAVLFVFSRVGFTDDAIDFMRENGMAWTDDYRWIEGEVI